LTGDFNAPTISGGLTLSGGGTLTSQTGSAVVDGGHLVIQNYTATPIIEISNGGSIVTQTLPNNADGVVDSGGSLTVNSFVSDLNLTVRGGSSFRAPNVHNGLDRSVTIQGAGSSFTVDQQFGVEAGFVDIDGGTLTVSGQFGLDGGTDNGGNAVGGGGHWQGSTARISTSQAMFVGIQTGSFSLAIDGGAVLNTGSVAVAAETGSQGTINLSGEPTLWEVSAGGMTVGQSGTARFDISGGADLLFDPGTEFFIGKGAGSIALMTLDGANSVIDARNAVISIGDAAGSRGSLVVSNGAEFQVRETCFIGYGGQGSVSLDSGSTLVQDGERSTEFIVGNFPGASGSLSVNGAQTNFLIDSPMQIGSGGTGFVGVGNRGAIDSFTVTLGNTAASNGTVVLDGTESIWKFSGGGGLLIGNEGTGTWTTQTGAHIELGDDAGFMTLGRVAGGNGTFTLTDTGSLFTVRRKVAFGFRGTGTGVVSAGATAQSVTVGIGLFGGSNGSLTITGAGSTWTNAGAMYVGGLPVLSAGGTGQLMVQDGATLRVATNFFVGDGGSVSGNGRIAVGSGDFGAPGTLRISAGGMLTGSEHVSMQIIVGTGGRLAPGSSPGLLALDSFQQEAGGSLNIEIGGTSAGTGFDQVQVSGAAILGGALNVRLIDGFTPSVGQTFRILTAASVTGNFSSISEPSNAGISVSQDATGVTVTVTSVVAGAPVINSPTTAIAPPGLPFTYQIAATNSPANFGAANLPDGLTVDSATGVISGTPTSGGAFVVPIAGNNAAGSGLADLTLLVEDLNFDVDVGVALGVPAQLQNIATRMRVQAGDNALIGGFIVTGTDPKKVIIRGIGPSLSSFFSGALADPTLELFQGSTLLMSNDNWKTDQQAEIEATGIPPTNDLESAIVRTLTPGSYTAVLRGKNDTTGVGVVEAYDLDQAANSKLANISTRGFVETGDNVMIGGLIVGPPDGANATIVVRAIGPTLGNFGIQGALQDPTLDLVNSDGVVIRSNNDWRESQEGQIIAAGLAPSDDRESALIETLAPGSYTAIVRGAGDTTGVGLVEAYHLQ
jgi:T5SS/PEP-CTERM-associated repeat protein